MDEISLEALLLNGPLTPAEPGAGATRDALVDRIRRFIEAS
jgi:hypothetical protein